MLRAVELELLRARDSRHTARPRARGQVELSTSPFYHPILPLLCDSDAHLRAHPQARAAARAVRAARGCAAADRARDRAFTRRRSAAGRAGMWPSEGSVSDEAVALIADAGLSVDCHRRGHPGAFARAQPMRPELLYRPYRVGDARAGRVCSAITRCRIASGFTYQSWDAGAAADDFRRPRPRGGPAVRARPPAGKSATVSVILDGENAWEHYAGGGRPFLRALYGALERRRRHRDGHDGRGGGRPGRRRCRAIFPGSWINGDFYIWVGHRDDHRAWAQLAAARAAFDARAALVDAPSARPGARGAADRRRQRLVLVVRRRPFVGPRRRVRRAVPPPSAQRLRRARRAGSRGAVRHQHHAPAPVPDRLEPSGLLTVDPGRPGHQLIWNGWGRSSPSLAKPGGAMHEVAAPSLIAEVRVGLSHDGAVPPAQGAGLMSARQLDGAALALIVGRDRGPRRPDRALVDGRRDHYRGRPIPFDRDRRRPRLRACSSRSRFSDRSGAVLETVPHGRSWTIAIPESPRQRPTDWQA